MPEASKRHWLKRIGIIWIMIIATGYTGLNIYISNLEVAAYRSINEAVRKGEISVIEGKELTATAKESVKQYRLLRFNKGIQIIEEKYPQLKK